jgi:hypothetical protein
MLSLRGYQRYRLHVVEKVAVLIIRDDETSVGKAFIQVVFGADRRAGVGLTSRGHATPANGVVQSLPQTFLPHLYLSLHQNLLRSAGHLSRWRRQRHNPLEHAAIQLPRQMNLRQEQPTATDVLYQASAGLHQPLLQTGQSPKTGGYLRYNQHSGELAYGVESWPMVSFG